MNLRELNYILIPKSAGSWEQFQSTRTGRLVLPFLEVVGSATKEGQAVFVAMLVTGAAGIDVRYSHLYLVFSGLFGLLITALLLRPLGFVRAAELGVDVEHPPKVVSGEPLTITLVLHNTGARPLYALRVSGPFLPWDGSYHGPPPAVDLLRPGETARLPVTARFLVRGARSLGPFSVGSIRPLGLARGNRRPSPPLRFIVLPRAVRVVEMPLPPWRYVHLGSPQAAAGGESLELLGVRPYRAGDRPRDLHWRAWARHGGTDRNTQQFDPDRLRFAHAHGLATESPYAASQFAGNRLTCCSNCSTPAASTWPIRRYRTAPARSIT